MNRTRIFVHNALTTALLQAFTMLSGFILPRIMLGVYGSEINGIVTSLTQFIACFNLVEAGISAAATYSLYRPIAERNAAVISGIVVAARNFYNKTGFIFVALTVGLAVIYPLFVHTDLLSPVEIGVLVLILGINGALEFFTLAKYRALLTADQKTYVVSLASIVAIVINVGVFAGAALSGMSVVMAKFLAAFSIFVRTFLLWVYCRHHYTYLDYNAAPIPEALSRSWDALYLQILGVVHSSAPMILATFLTDLKTLSVFAIYNLVAVGLQGLLGIFISGLSASFGDIIARKELHTLQVAESQFEFAYYLLIAATYGVAMLFIVPFVVLYTEGVQDANYNQPLLGFLLLLNGLLYNIKTPQGMLVISAGLYRETRWQTTTQGLIEVLAGAAFGYIWGIWGILIGMILSNIYRDIDLPFFISKHVTQISPWSSFRRMTYIAIITAVIYGVQYILPIAPQSFFVWTCELFVAIFYALLVTIAVAYVMEPGTSRALLGRFRTVGGK